MGKMNRNQTIKELEYLSLLCDQSVEAASRCDLYRLADPFTEVYLKALEYLSELSDDPEAKEVIDGIVGSVKYSQGKRAAMRKAAMEYDMNLISGSRKNQLS